MPKGYRLNRTGLPVPADGQEAKYDGRDGPLVDYSEVDGGSVDLSELNYADALQTLWQWVDDNAVWITDNKGTTSGADYPKVAIDTGDSPTSINHEDGGGGWTKRFAIDPVGTLRTVAGGATNGGMTLSGDTISGAGDNEIDVGGSEIVPRGDTRIPDGESVFFGADNDFGVSWDDTNSILEIVDYTSGGAATALSIAAGSPPDLKSGVTAGGNKIPTVSTDETITGTRTFTQPLTINTADNDVQHYMDGSNGSNTDPYTFRYDDRDFRLWAGGSSGIGRVLVAYTDGKIEIPNGIVSIQGETSATEPYVDNAANSAESSANNYTDNRVNRAAAYRQDRLIKSSSGTEYFYLGRINDNGENYNGRTNVRLYGAHDQGSWNSGIGGWIELEIHCRSGNAYVEHTRKGGSLADPVNIIISEENDGSSTSKYHLYVKANDYCDSYLVHDTQMFDNPTYTDGLSGLNGTGTGNESQFYTTADSATSTIRGGQLYEGQDRVVTESRQSSGGIWQSGDYINLVTTTFDCNRTSTTNTSFTDLLSDSNKPAVPEPSIPSSCSGRYIRLSTLVDTASATGTYRLKDDFNNTTFPGTETTASTGGDEDPIMTPIVPHDPGGIWRGQIQAKTDDGTTEVDIVGLGALEVFTQKD